MAKVANNWLCILLACLLGIAPLGRALADVHSPLPVPQGHAMSPAMSHDGPHAAEQMAEQQCEKCISAHTCDSHDCPCSQCASCITSFLPVLLNIHFDTLSQGIPAGEHGTARDLPSLLYRPPRS